MEKEERRRKIISRGNDRLALITGKIQKLESDAFPKSSSFNAPDRREDVQGAQHARSASEYTAPDDKSFLRGEYRQGGDGVPETIMENDEEVEVPKRNDQRMLIPEVQNHNLQKHEEKPELQKLSDKRKVQKHDAQKQEKKHDPQRREGKEVAVVKSDIAVLAEKYLDYILGSISLKEINFSIITTEDIRVMCTIVLAVMVVLYHAFVPQNTTRHKSLIGHRPMYVLLLTDVCIVATRLAPFAQRRREEIRAPQVQEVGDGQEWGGAIRLMELGLVLHQTVRALFIDLSFYVVIVVSGITML
ncbi:uncharacterized protein LOC127243587 [Andrographis paniculata]|uniref:uncharacterized protein LOC127243587 n=1 Tax=Andrographis paniculata TaxID=175694 RepID=UPI0021E795BB|nr:uncharacterized protein LOC127243587 [Andrographis paniculata]